MNPFEKVYCRTVQGALRAASPVLPYRNPMTLDGIAQLPHVLHRKQIDSVLLVTDQGIRGIGLTNGLETMLHHEHIRCIVYDKTVANPTSQNVEEARELYLKENCQAIIGFGGGSSIDCAKAVGARIAKPHQSLKQMGGVLKVHKILPLLIAVPTTAGTGSEVTVAAVITDSETHHKYAITDFCLIPHFAILDPELTRSLPPDITACTAMDALTHAIEAFIGRSTFPESRKDALEAVRLIFANLDKAYQNGDDLQARRRLLRASYLAGRAFSRSYVGYVHAVAHSLSGKYNLPHGYTNAVLLPWVLEAYGPSIDDRLAQIAVAADVADSTDAPEKAAAALIEAIRGMNRRFGIPTGFKELRREDIPELARTASKEGNPLYPVPVLMSHTELESLYALVLEENDEA